MVFQIKTVWRSGLASIIIALKQCGKIPMMCTTRGGGRGSSRLKLFSLEDWLALILPSNNGKKHHCQPS